MKIFINWMQNKLNRRQYSSKKPSANPNRKDYAQEDQYSCKEEFTEWTQPHRLLAIGTIGNINLKEAETKMRKKASILKENSSPCSLKATCRVDSEVEDQMKRLQNDNLNYLLLLHEHVADSEAENTSNVAYSDNQNGHLRLTTSTVAYNTKSVVSRKSLSFLVKKMITNCRSGFVHAPNLKDPVSESRTDKIMRVMLDKKIYPKTCGATMSKSMSSTRRYLKNRVHTHIPKSANEDDDVDYFDKAENNRSKWVKTDSEYIVLEL